MARRLKTLEPHCHDMTAHSPTMTTRQPAGAPHFHDQDGTLHAEGVSLAELGQALGTPLYV